MKNKESKSPVQSDLVLSGLQGGPAAGKGFKYQVDFSILIAFQQLDHSFRAPHLRLTIGIEPRLVSKDALITWDVSTNNPMIFYEAKLKPTRQEIIEFLKRAKKGSADPKFFFTLVTARFSHKLELLKKYLRLATEGPNKTSFREKVLREKVVDDVGIEKTLGQSMYEILHRIKVEFHPESGLQNDLKRLSAVLVGEADSGRLIEHLRARFFEAIPNRVTFLISELADELAKERFAFRLPISISSSELSDVCNSAIYILQHCKAPLSLDVLSNAIECESDSLIVELQPLLKSDFLRFEGGTYSLQHKPRSIYSHPRGADLLERSLEGMLREIDVERNYKAVYRQLANIEIIADLCFQNRKYRNIAKMFSVLDKYLKQMGNKHLVLDLAKLSVVAASRADRDDDIVKWEARALICGISWVYQRTGQLDFAMAAAKRSLELGTGIEWQVNTAFCKKCMGRLARLQAEYAKSLAEKKKKISESISLLKEAIQEFTHLPGYGDNHPEVGDCHSLLGRTYLYAGDIVRATNEINEAFSRITDERSKDYLDIVILQGDVETATKNRVALEHYNRVLELCPPHTHQSSEIVARTYLQRGLFLEKVIKNLQGASDDYERAASIWMGLGEHNAEYQARWAKLRANSRLPQRVLDILMSETPHVRVLAVEAHNERNISLASSHARRDEVPDKRYWNQLIKEAKRKTTIKEVHW